MIPFSNAQCAIAGLWLYLSNNGPMSSDAIDPDTNPMQCNDAAIHPWISNDACECAPIILHEKTKIINAFHRE